MIVASFYAPRPGYPQHDPYDFWDCLRLQRASCKRFDIEHLVITDEGGWAVAPPDLMLFVTPLPVNVMQASLVAHLSFLEAAKRTEDLLLLDADGVLTRDPRPLFDGSFELAATTHPFTDSILNNGLIAVSKGSAGLAAPFWRAALAQAGMWGWGEDQKALGRALNATLEHGVHDRNGARVKFLPCPGFNWAPETVDDPTDALFVHFRGPRKKWMRAWVDRFARDPA